MEDTTGKTLGCVDCDGEFSSVADLEAHLKETGHTDPEAKPKFRVIEDPDGQVNVTAFSGIDEYGGEWGGWFMVGVEPGKQLTKEDWIRISRVWELYCAGKEQEGAYEDKEPEEWEWEWDYVTHANLGAYEAATFQSRDRGGCGIFVRHP